jgi:hypothetical protein
MSLIRPFLGAVLMFLPGMPRDQINRTSSLYRMSNVKVLPLHSSVGDSCVMPDCLSRSTIKNKAIV